MPKPFKTTLPNGLRVILLENHTAPVVSFNLWANVGSVHETDSEAGICHLIEHMLFKGTGRRPVGQIAKEVEAAGGDINAYTSFDETVFYINMSSRKWPVGLDILADAATDPTFDLEELTREKEVVVEEISRSEDNPGQMVSQDLFGKAFSVHPYRRSIAGNRETVRGISQEHLIQFFKKWYVGPNLIFIGVGDFSLEAIVPQIEKLFSRISSQSPPTPPIPAEPTQQEQRLVTRGMPVQGRYFDLSFPMPGLIHPDIPALDVLSHILGGGPSSRLERALKEKRGLVTSISSYPYSPKYPGLFIVGGVLKEKALKETIQGTWEEMERFRSETPSTVEFARARENIRSARIYERQTVEAMARKLGFFEGIADDINFEEVYYQRLAEVTPEEVQEVARRYFVPDRITVSFCHPKEEKWAPEKIRSWLPGTQQKRATVAKIKKPSGEIESIRLKSGIRLLVRENHHLPLISVRSASLGGLRMENQKNSGIGHLISFLVTKGTLSRTSREISEQIEGISGHLDGYMGRNLTGLLGTFLSEKMAEGFGLFFDLLLHPSFPEEEIVKEKGHTTTAIRNEEDSLAGVAMKKFLAALYPRHPYGLPVMGTLSSVKSLRRSDLIRYYQSMVRPDNLVLSVVGDVSAAEVRERFEETLKPWVESFQKTKKISPPRNPLDAPKEPMVIVTKKKKLQAHIVYGFLGTTIRNPDRYALEVMNSILAGQGGRLFLELRDKRGLAYAISSSTQEGIEPGFLMIYMGTDPVKVEKSLQGIREELQKIREHLVTAEELDRSKRFIIGNYELDLQRNETVAALLSNQEIYRLDRDEILRYPEKIERITREDILRVAKKYLLPKSSVLSIVKP